MPELVPDLTLVLCLSYLTNALLVVVLAASGRTFRGGWLWVLAQILLAAGTISDALPSSVDLWIPWVGGNSVYVASCVVYLHAVWVFRFERPFPWGLYLLLPLQVLSFVLAFDQGYLVRAQVFALWMGVGSLAVGGLLLAKVERRFWVASGLTAMPFLILGGVSVLRFFLLADQASRGEVTNVSPLNVWSLIGAILLSTITLFGYFMMTGIQSLLVLIRKDEEIESRNQRLIEASQAKDLFFAIVAHDLRGPISGSARYVRKHLLGKMTGLEAKATEVATVADTLDRTNEFLEKLLWWTRAQLEGWKPPRVAFRLDTALSLVVKLLEPVAVAKNVTVVVGAPEVAAWADPESVPLILASLLSNAIKFSPSGQTVTVGLTVEADHCAVRISDQGCGMAPEVLARLFRIDHKVTTVGTAGEHGSGMGLVLAKTLAERNGGQVVLTSQPGQGTQATLILPLAPVET